MDVLGDVHDVAVARQGHQEAVDGVVQSGRPGVVDVTDAHRVFYPRNKSRSPLFRPDPRSTVWQTNSLADLGDSFHFFKGIDFSVKTDNPVKPSTT